MPSRKPANRQQEYVGIMTTASRELNKTFEEKSGQAAYFDNLANRGRENNGQMMRKADKARIKTVARQIRKDASTPGNNYRYGTKEEVQAQHNSTYRNLRRAFGMSAG